MALTYTVFDSAAENLPPNRDYLDSILRGARDRGFPAEYIAQLARIKAA
jgi:hypothetical protein